MAIPAIVGKVVASVATDAAVGLVKDKVMPGGDEKEGKEGGLADKIPAQLLPPGIGLVAKALF